MVRKLRTYDSLRNEYGLDYCGRLLVGYTAFNIALKEMLGTEIDFDEYYTSDYIRIGDNHRDYIFVKGDVRKTTLEVWNGRQEA